MSNYDRKQYDSHTISVYLPEVIKQQLIFFAKSKNMKPATVCRKIITNFILKKDIAQQMLYYAMEHISKEQA